MSGATRGLRRLSRKPSFEALVRAGFVARGLIYAIVGGLALALALGATGGRATSQQGALALLAAGPLGTAAIAAVALCALAYAVWKLVQAVLGRGPEGGGGEQAFDRFSNGAAGVSYVVFFATIGQVLLAGPGGGGGGAQHPAAGVLGWPGGRLLVGAAGLVLIVVCAVQGKEGIAGDYLEQWKRGEISPRMRPVVFVLGRVGLVARALVFALVGYFLIKSAVQFDPAKSVGIDGALRSLARTSPWLLGIVAAGLLVFTLYSLAEARYRRL